MRLPIIGKTYRSQAAAYRAAGVPKLLWRVEWYSGGFARVEAYDFDVAAKLAIRIAKRQFLRISALYLCKE